MTSHTGRLYGLALALLVFFVTWAAIAAKPWAQASADPRAAALTLREQRLRHEAAVVQQLVRRRWAAYRTALRQRNAAIASVRRARPAAASAAAAPAVRVVNLPPLTITRTS
jgi:hypothetical protein